MPFTVGQLVVCIEATGNLVAAEPADYDEVSEASDDLVYRVYFVSPNGTAIRVEGDNVTYRANRFVDRREWLNNQPPAYQYDDTEFEGCCGARTIFLDHEKPRVDCLRMTTNGIGMVGIAFAILTPEQKTEGGHEAMLEAGWREVAQTYARDGHRILTSYVYENRPVNQPVVEAERTF